MISSIKELREMLSCKSIQEATKSGNVTILFDEIARFLIENCIIIDNNGHKYGFQNIEFYLYNKNHRDIITHPRLSKALQWYINDFGGIDLNFESIYEESDEYYASSSKKKPILNDNCCFGGILIRKLRRLDKIDSKHLILNGPLACAELFRTCDAEKKSCDFPILKEKVSHLKLKQKSSADQITGRYNLYRKWENPETETKRKVDNILSNYSKKSVFDYPENMYNAFDAFKDKPYWYEAE